MTRLDLSGVELRKPTMGSKRELGQYDEAYPFDFDPYAHQIALRRLVHEKEAFIAVNDSPTGGGKTSSWLAPALEERLNTIAIYPTNALIIDQADSIRDDTDVVDHDVAVMQVTSGDLYKKRDEFDTNSHGDVIEQWFTSEERQNDQILFLTNPDIFVMMCRDLYRNTSRRYKRFEFVVVDEFHRAGRKEQNTLRYLLDELYDQKQTISYLQKIAFLSATPDEEQERKFERAMTAPYHRLTENLSSERQPFTDSSTDGWHPVMPPVELDVHSAPTFATADVLLGDDSEETLSFCRGGRTVVMLDGIHEVRRVSEWLKTELDAQVERIDGFHRENKRDKLREFDVLVSNSAVEVGIDFDVERVLFAGHDRASFLQRLGRLRNDDRPRNARCYVPTRVGRGLEEYDNEELTRRELDSVLEEMYPEPRKPQSFDWRYSAVESLHHLESRLGNANTDQHTAIKNDGRERIRRHFLADADITFHNEDLQRTKNALDWRVLTDLQWYRGDSIRTLVYDCTEDQLKPYDLFYLLRYGKVNFFTQDEFGHVIPAGKTNEIGRYERYVDGFCTYHGPIEMTDEGYGRNVYFTGSTFTNWLDSSSDRTRKPKVVPGVKVQATSNEGQSQVQSLDKLNQYLKNRSEHAPGNDGGLLCYPVYGTAKTIKQLYNLGSFFILYPVKVQTAGTHSLAIGTDALYLHCHVRERDERRNKGEETNEDEGFIGL